MMGEVQTLAAPASFTGLGTPFNLGSSRATAVSPDGSVVVGGGLYFGYSILWESGNAYRLELAENRFLTESSPYDVSIVDGEPVVVGYAHGQHYRWTTEGVSFDLESLGGNYNGSFATGLSDDATVVVGVSLILGAYRWTADGEIVALGSLTPQARQSYASGVSADGSVVVGESGSQAFRWDEVAGIAGLGYLAGGEPFSVANAVSGDGSVIIGQSSSLLGTETFRWTADGGMVGLGDLDGGDFESDGLAVSSNGNVIVGQGTTATGAAAFMWTPDRGMRLLEDVLITDYGLDLTGWSLTTATGISADGKTIVGTGINPAGVQEAFVAVVPEPSTFAMAVLGMALFGLMVFHHRR